jgi:hypothetical protein
MLATTLPAQSPYSAARAALQTVRLMNFLAERDPPQGGALEGWQNVANSKNVM